MSELDHSSDMANDEIELDLRQIVAVLKKWGKLIVIVSLVLALCAGLISKLLIRPVYQAKSLVMVTKATEKLQTNAILQQNKNLEDVVSSAARMPIMTMNTYQSQLKGAALLTRVVEKANLNCSAGQLAGMINTSIIKDSNMIEVTVQNSDPVLASRIANTLVVEYQQMMNEKDQDAMNRSVSFLQEQRAVIDKEMQTATEQLNEFYRQPRGAAVLEAEFTSMSEDLAGFESRLKDARVEVERLSAGVATLEDELRATPRTVVTSIGSGQQNYADLEEANPLYISIAEQLAQKRAELAEKKSEAGSLQAMIMPMKAQLDSLEAELVIKKTTQSKMEQDIQRLKDTSETLAKKEIETQIAKSIDMGDISVVVLSEAFIPSAPVKPNTKLNIAVALIMGLMVFTLLAFVMEYFDNTLKNSEDIEDNLGLPVLGVIPATNGDTKLYSRY